MGLLIETEEADRLARQLAALTGESVEGAVVNALAERLRREQRKSAASGGLAARLEALTAPWRAGYDTRPVTPEEWAAVSREAS